MRHSTRVASGLLWGATAVLGLCTPVRANPVWGKLFEHHQPDGQVVQVRIWGDEFYRVVESLDGYTLVPDPQTKAACYARLSADGNDLISTGVRAGGQIPLPNLARHLRIKSGAAQRKAATARQAAAANEGAIRQASGMTSAAAPPSSGNVVGICLLVDFSDDPATIAASAINNYCNQAGYTGYGNNGSIHDYFYTVSDGNLTYTNYVPSTYYRALQPKTYYEDPSVSYGTRAGELIIEALTSLNAQGFDFSQYDANHDGWVDGINCLYAGTCHNAWAKGLWPHSSGVFFQADGVYTSGYQMTDIGNSLTISTFCHENGHMICNWPDLYDYGYESNGVGGFCLMAYGTNSTTNPPEPCAYLKAYSGWSTVNILSAPQTGVSVPASGTNVCYKFPRPGQSNEYYLIENRQKTGRDSGLPDSGLAIWHIDTNGSNNDEQMTPALHYKVTLVQADGRWDLEHKRNYGDATDLYAAPGYTACTPVSTPNTNWWDGSASGLNIWNISASADTMAFDFLPFWDCNNNGYPDNEDVSLGRSPDCNANGTPDECDIASGFSADCNGNFVPDSCDPDVDVDGRIDDCDNCPGVANADQADHDSDGMGDACDTDDDNDTVADVSDNCPFIINVDQQDDDSDGAGNACDLCPDTIPEATVDGNGCPPFVHGDFDRDGDVDQADYGHLQACLLGEDVPQSDPACVDARLDADNDVGSDDVMVFLNCKSGANRPGNPSCAP